MCQCVESCFNCSWNLCDWSRVRVSDDEVGSQTPVLPPWCAGEHSERDWSGGWQGLWGEVGDEVQDALHHGHLEGDSALCRHSTNWSDAQDSLWCCTGWIQSASGHSGSSKPLRLSQGTSPVWYQLWLQFINCKSSHHRILSTGPSQTSSFLSTSWRMEKLLRTSQGLFRMELVRECVLELHWLIFRWFCWLVTILIIVLQIFIVLTNLLSEFKMTLPDGDKGEIGTQSKVSTW